MFPDTPLALADEHARRLRRDAGRARLAALARCCSPSALRTVGTSVLAWLRRGQLGPVANYCPCP